MLTRKGTFRVIAFILLTILTAFTLTGCMSFGGDGTGKPAPDFTLPDLSGTNVTLSAYKGQNVMLNFWASWCGPCTEEMPDIQRIYEEYKDKGLVVLTINPGEDAATIKSFMESNKYTFPVLVDAERSTAKLYNTSSIPVTLFIDKEGKVAVKKVGLMTGDEMRTAIEQLQ